MMSPAAGGAHHDSCRPMSGRRFGGGEAARDARSEQPDFLGSPGGMRSVTLLFVRILMLTCIF
jgi:hypothetical protein